MFGLVYSDSLTCIALTRMRGLDPETSIDYVKNSLPIESSEMNSIRAAAAERSIAVVLGFSERSGGSVYLAQAIIGPDGKILLTRRKYKATYVERTVYGDADSTALNTVTTVPGLGRVGALNCWENIQPLLKFWTATQGEQIHVAGWPSGAGTDPNWGMSSEGFQAATRVHSLETGAFSLCCTAVLSEKGIKAHMTEGHIMYGKAGGGASAIYGPDGRLLSEPLPPTQEGIIYGDLNLDDCVSAKVYDDVVGHYSRSDLLWLGYDKTHRTALGPQ